MIPKIFEVDEGPRPDTSLEILAKLRPMTKDGTVTAGNASSQNDAASVCLVVAADKLDELGLKPMAFLRGWSVAGVHPAYMGIGPVPAVQKLFARTGMTFDDIDIVELNEAFASQVLAVVKEWKLEDDEQAQRERLRHFAGPSHCRDRCAYPHDHVARDAAPGRALRARDHVRWRRSGGGGAVRASRDVAGGKSGPAARPDVTGVKGDIGMEHSTFHHLRGAIRPPGSHLN